MKNGPIALTHTRHFSSRSAFLVFIKLPGGRAATLAYLDKLNTFPKPWSVVPKLDDTGRFIDAVVSGAVPQFPVGTQVALVRQAVAITDGGAMVATPTTESVQFRTYLQVPPKESNNPRPSQGFAELELRRADLFAGKAGGLHAFEGDEVQYGVASTLSNYADPFESSPEKWFHKPLPAFVSCAACHPQAGILGVNSYTRANRYDPPPTIGLFPTTPIEERKKVVAWKEATKDWAALKKAAGW